MPNVNQAIVNWVYSRLLGSALVHVAKKATVSFFFTHKMRRTKEVVGGSIPKQRIALKDGNRMAELATRSMK